MIKNKLSKERVILIYLSVIFILCVVYYLLEFFSHGEYFSSLFANDSTNTFMDYFNSLNNAKFDPYKDKFSNYPAMACLLYKFFFEMIPYGLREGDGFTLRNIQAALIPFIVYNAVIIWLMQTSIREKSLLSKTNKIIFSIIILLCAPIVFTLERGNLILLSFVLTMFFAFFYDCENNVLKEISFMALAFAASIKIYPAIFGLLILKRRNGKDIIRLVLYGVGLFIAPFFYYDGFASLKLMIEALGYTSNLSDVIGYGVNLSLYNIIQTFEIVFNTYMSDILKYTIYIIIVAILLFGVLMLKKRWQESLCITLLLIFLPKTNYYYVMIFMIIPIVEFLNECQVKEEAYSTVDYIVFSLFAVILIPWASKIIPVFSGYKFFVTYSMLVYYIALCCLVMVILYEIIKIFSQKRIRIYGPIVFIGTGIFSLSTIIAAMMR